MRAASLLAGGHRPRLDVGSGAPVQRDGQTLGLDRRPGRGPRLQPGRYLFHRRSPPGRISIGGDDPISTPPLEAVEADELWFASRTSADTGLGRRHQPAVGQMFPQERDRPPGHHGDHTEPSGQLGQDLGGPVEGTGAGRIVDDRRQRAVEVGHDRRGRRVLQQRRQRAADLGDRAAGRLAAPVHPVVADQPAVAAVVGVVVDTSGPATTTTSAVPMVGTGAAVVYGTTDEAGSWSSEATVAADC